MATMLYSQRRSGSLRAVFALLALAYKGCHAYLDVINPPLAPSFNNMSTPALKVSHSAGHRCSVLARPPQWPARAHASRPSPPHLHASTRASNQPCMLTHLTRVLYLLHCAAQ